MSGDGAGVTRLSRRRALLAALSLLPVTACLPRSATTRPTLSDPAEPLPPFADRIGLLEWRHNAFVGLYGADLASGAEVAHRENDLFAMCSTFKTYAVARVLQMSQTGAVRLTDGVFVDPAQIVAHSPITGARAGTRMPLSEICAAALQHSDNTAANLLLKTIGGPPAITAFARSIGDDATRLDRWETALNSAVPGDPRDTSRPRALGTGYRNVLVGNVLADPGRTQLVDWMRGNVASARSIRAGLQPGWTTVDRTGAGGYGSTNAVGMVFGPDGQRLLLSIMTRSRADDPDAPMLQPLIAEVTTLVVPYLTRA